MIDEKKLIKKLQDRIDDFTKQHPDQKNCEQIQVQREFIHEVELAAAENNSYGWIPCSERLPDTAGYEVLATLENKYGQRRCAIVFTGYGDSQWNCNYKGFDIDAWKVIAWMPLPKSYKESEV